MAEEQVTTTASEPAAEPAGMDIDAAADQIFEGMGMGEDVTPASPEPKDTAGEDKAALQAGEETPAAKPDDPSQTASAPATPVAKAPDTWTKEAQAEFAKLSPTVQSEIAKREGDIAKYVQETNTRVQVAQGIENMIQPYMGMFQQYRVNPFQHIHGLLNAHAKLMFGQPQEKAHVAFALLKDAGIDVSKLAGENPLAAIGQPNQEVAALRQRIAELEGGVTSVTSHIQAQRQAEVEQDVAKFAEDPAHPHFNEVAEDMMTLLRSGVCKTLQQAYEKSVWSNPIVRQKELARINSDAQKRAEEQRKAQLNTARRAARVNVRGVEAGGAATPNANWEAGMADTLAEVKERLAG